MTRLAWLTDIHMDFLDDRGREAFASLLRACPADAFLITGDISNAWALRRDLDRLRAWARRPVYFVLGNHDYYGDSIVGVREDLAARGADTPDLVWLTVAGVVSITHSTALVGHDGWYDARLGDYDGSRVMMSDFHAIEELRELDRLRLRRALQRLADEAVDHFERILPAAFETHRNLLLLTHVPPFLEASWHEGRHSSDKYLPFMSCGALGEALKVCMLDRPDRHLTVLCGHTHGAGTAQILPNLVVHTGGAEYGRPGIAWVLDAE